MTKKRLATLFIFGLAAVLVTIIIQNPDETPFALLFWTVSLQQGLGLVLAFLCGIVVGWTGSAVYRSRRGARRGTLH